jgi:hypothetical protein
MMKYKGRNPGNSLNWQDNNTDENPISNYNMVIIYTTEVAHMTEQTVAQRLEALNIVLPNASEPAAKYANFVNVNGLLFVSGKGPSGNPKCKLGKDFTTQEGYWSKAATAVVNVP